MVNGAIAHSVADAAVAVTGSPGPDGGTPEKPVGTVASPGAHQTMSKQPASFNGLQEIDMRSGGLQ